MDARWFRDGSGVVSAQPSLRMDLELPKRCALCDGAHGRAYPLAVDGRVVRGPHRHARVSAGTPLCLRCTCNVDDSLPPPEASHETGGTRAGSSARAEGDGSCAASGGGGGASC